MRQTKNKPGFSLSEVLVVIGVAALLLGLGVNAVKGIVDSLENADNTRGIISAALSNARAMAIGSGNNYVGVRFQQDTTGRQYLIFIERDQTATGLVNGYRAVKGRQPIALPKDLAVMDTMIRINTNPDVAAPEKFINSDADLDSDEEIINATTFSVIFSPAGKLVVNEVRTRNRNGLTASDTPPSSDDIFNTYDQVQAGYAKFYQDDDDGSGTYIGLGQEMSRNSFIIYDRKTLASQLFDARYTDYIQSLLANNTLYINPYTGEIMN